jgi:(S)-mandelate dehydrogenase
MMARVRSASVIIMETRKCLIAALTVSISGTNMRSALDAALHPRWLCSVMGRYLAKGMPSHVNFPPQYQQKFTGSATEAKALRADLVSWDDVSKPRDIWPRKLILKGIMRVDDAIQAVARGVDAIVVSNHGGRNLNSAPGTLDVLPASSTPWQGGYQ